MSEDNKFNLDELDKRILNALQDNAARTNQELAELVHASPPTCLRRVKRLEEIGVIARQVVLLCPEKVGAGLSAIVEITLDIQSNDRLVEFEKLMANEIAVQQCYRVSSGLDFVLILQVPDMPAYHALAHRLFANHANVRNVRCFFSVLRSKFETRMAV
jgi:Lrp/AsnC family leucine-responsive transcriptional regulator